MRATPSVRAGRPLVLLAAVATCFAIAASARHAAAGGLSCSIGEVVVENLKIGHRYSLKTLANLPLTVTNTSDRALSIEITPQIPGPSELKQNAEAIPDLSWASSVPETLVLDAHRSGTAELILAIPDDERLFGRKFEAIFWSHSLPQEGELLAYGLKSRVIFSVDTTRDVEDAEPIGSLSVTLQPAELRLEPLAPGKRRAITGESGHGVTLRNTSDRPIDVELKALSAADAGVPLDGGCEDLKALASFDLPAARIRLAPGEERTVNAGLTLARNARVRGKNLMCVLSAEVMDQPVRSRIYSRIYAHGK